MCFLNNKTWKLTLLLGPRAAEWVFCFSRHENINLIVQRHQGSWVTRCVVTEQYYFEKNFVFRMVGLKRALKIFNKACCKQMCCHPNFVVPLTEHRQNRLTISCEGPRIFRMVTASASNLSSPAALTRNRRVLLSFEALEPGTDFSQGLPSSKIRLLCLHWKSVV